MVGFSNGGIDCIIENSFSTANISGYQNTGGLVGGIHKGKISNSFSGGHVKSSYNYAGGLVGQTVNVDIENSYSTGNISGIYGGTGGLVGYAGAGKTNFTNCYALNENVTSSMSSVNRLVGTVNNNSNLTVTDCFAWENMTGKTFNETDAKKYGSDLTSSEIWNTFPDEKWTGWSTTGWAANDYFKFRLPVPSWTNKNIQADAVYLMPPITLTYNGNGQTSDMSTIPADNTVYPKPSESGYPKNATVKSSGDMKKEGFDFEKWTTKPGGTGVAYMPGDEIEMSESLTLYAQWKEAGKNTNGSSGNGTGSASVVNPAEPIKPENNMTGFENETIIEEPENLEIIKPFLILLFFLLAIAVYILIKRRRDEEEEKQES